MSYQRFRRARSRAVKRFYGASFFAALASMVAPTSVLAQSSADVDEVMEEVVVTARNTEETLQEVPVAITAIGRDTLDIFRIDEAEDLLSRIPALSINIGGSGASAQINLRGVGSSSISNAFDSAIALNYDGISVSTQRLLQSAFFDVEQVSVLKGPQSLYFGKAASGGVLALRSAEPTEQWEVGAKSSYEFDENGTTFGGFVSGPLSETLGFRLAAEYQTIDKFVVIDDLSPTIDNNRGLNNLVARATFDWNPTDTVNANLKVNYNRQRSQTLNGRLDVFCGGDGVPDPSIVVGGAFGATPGIDLFPASHDCDINDGRFVSNDGNALINVVPTGSPGENRSDISQAYNDTDTYFGRLKVEADLSDTFALTVLLGYVDMDNEYNDSFNSTGQNPDGSPAGLVAPFGNTLEQFTSEVRLASNFSGPFNFQVGAFWEDRDIGLITSQNAFNPSILGALAGPTGLPFGPDAATGFTFDWLADRPIEAEALSFFVSGEFAISEKWELSGGVRYTDEDKSTSIAFPFVHSFVTNIFGAVASGFSTDDIDFSDDEWSPEVVLRYIHNDNMSFYGAYKTGFKSGGIDNNTLPTTGTILADLNSTDDAVRDAAAELLTFASETSEGFELGLRSQWFDRTLTLNATAFFFEYEDQQVQLFDPVLFGFDTFNAGELTTQGIDIDFAWATPIEGLSVFGAWGFLDAEVTGDLITSTGANLNGREASRAPTWSGNIAIDYETRVSDALRLRISPNFFFSDSYFAGGASRNEFDAVTNPQGDFKQDSYVTIDLNVSLISDSANWRLSLIASNLTDEQIVNTGGPAPFRPAPAGSPPTGGDDQLVNLRRGRQVFVEASYNF